jgi:hypothetical protein
MCVGHIVVADVNKSWLESKFELHWEELYAKSSEILHELGLGK